jgi:hypothetical protein
MNQFLVCFEVAENYLLLYRSLEHLCGLRRVFDGKMEIQILPTNRRRSFVHTTSHTLIHSSLDRVPFTAPK